MAMTASNLPEVSAATLADVLDRILDKGVVINADITVALVGVELLGLHVRLALASFETAARYGLEFPGGVNLEAPAWKAIAERERCPSCGRSAPREELLASGCPWCAWKTPRIAHQNGVLPLKAPD